MATTGQNILDRAIHRSSMFSESLVNTTEVLAWLAAEQKKLYMKAARWNPEYFGKTGTTNTRADADSAWSIVASPGDVAGITAVRANTIVGTVTGISVDDTLNFGSKRFITLKPPSKRCYLFGRSLYGYGSDLGSGANYVSVLELDYAELPAAPVNLDASLRLPDEWTTLLEVKIARIIAGRLREHTMVEELKEEYTEWFQAFEEHVHVLDHGAGRPVAATMVV